MTTANTTLAVTDLITLSLARWQALHGEVTVEGYRAIVAAAHEVAATDAGPATN